MNKGNPVERTEPTQEQMALLVDLSRKINSRLDVDTILHKVVEYSLLLSGAERGFLFLADGTDHMGVRVALDESGNEIPHDPIRVSSGVVSAMLAHGIPIFLENVKLNDTFARRKSIIDSGVQFIMGIPLRAKGRILGFVYVDNTTSARKFQKRDRQILTSFADQAALALENARLSREKREVEHEAALGRMGEQLLATVKDCVDRIGHCRKELVSIGGDEAARAEVDSMLAAAAHDLESRVIQFQEFREFMNDEIVVKVEPAEIDDIVSSVLDSLAHRFDEAGIRVHVSLNIGRSILLDPLKMKRVLEAVLTNAVEAAAGRPEPLVAITTAPVPEGLLVEIRDSGAGIPSADVERIFDPFYSSGKEDHPGIGLSIASRIVEMHRGYIEVKSREGEGTSVWIVIPSDLRPSLIPRARRSTNPPPRLA